MRRHREEQRLTREGRAARVRAGSAGGHRARQGDPDGAPPGSTSGRRSSCCASRRGRAGGPCSTSRRPCSTATRSCRRARSRSVAEQSRQPGLTVPRHASGNSPRRSSRRRRPRSRAARREASPTGRPRVGPRRRGARRRPRRARASRGRRGGSGRPRRAARARVARTPGATSRSCRRKVATWASASGRAGLSADRLAVDASRRRRGRRRGVRRAESWTAAAHGPCSSSSATALHQPPAGRLANATVPSMPSTSQRRALVPARVAPSSPRIASSGRCSRMTATAAASAAASASVTRSALTPFARASSGALRAACAASTAALAATSAIDRSDCD